MLIPAYGLLLLGGAPEVESGQDARKAVLLAFQAEAQATPKRSRTTVQLPTAEFSQELTVVLPDRFHVVWERDTTSIEFYVIGRTLYNRESGGWQVVTTHDRPKLETVMGGFGEAVRTGITEVTAIGQELLNGKTTARYRFQFSLDGELVQVHGAGDVWIDEATKLPVRLDFKGLWGDQEYVSSQTIEYGPDIRVDPPVNYVP